ncbi:hypothetical protein [Roseomonas sp. WA12]
MSKTPMKSTRRPNAVEALAAARAAMPEAPPATLPAPDAEAMIGFNMRLRVGTVEALEAFAKGRGKTMKQIVMEAIRDAGVDVAAVDLEDLSPARRRKRRR